MHAGIVKAQRILVPEPLAQDCLTGLGDCQTSILVVTAEMVHRVSEGVDEEYLRHILGLPCNVPLTDVHLMVTPSTSPFWSRLCQHGIQMHSCVTGELRQACWLLTHHSFRRPATNPFAAA